MRRLSSVCIFAALACVAAAANSAAQGVGAKPVLTESVDEPGRSPYQESPAGSCPILGTCTFTFSTVPIGKRLVVTYVNIHATVRAGSGALAFLSSTSTSISMPAVSNTPSPTDGATEYVMGSFTEFYIEAGQVPFVNVYGDFYTVTPGVVIVGYYVKL